MKKRLILIAVLCLCAVFSFTLFAACDKGGKDTCTSHVDADGDGKCDNCGETIGQVGEGAAISEGIFSASADASHKMILRFKADGTFYANDLMMQTAYQGKYEVVDMEVPYIDAGADDVINWELDAGGNKVTDDDGKWKIQQTTDPAANKDTVGLTSAKAVKFFESDGTTPFAVNDAATDHQFYGEEVPSNVVAYTVVDGEGRLHNVNLGGYTRTVRQDPDSDFSDSDEIRNLLYELMPEELPAWAAEANEADPDNPYTVQDLTFRIYHNGYDDLATAEYMISGTYTSAAGSDANTTVYTLSEGGTLTLTADGDDYSAVYKNGTEEIELVKWQKAQTGVTVMKELTASATVMQMNVDFTLTFNSDCTLVLAGSLMGSSIEITADWSMGGSMPPSVNFENASRGTFTFGWGESSTVVFTWTGKLSDNVPEETTVTFSMAASELGDLQGAAPVVEVKYTFEGTDAKVGKITLELFDDQSLKLTAQKGTDKETVIDTGTWSSEGVNFTLNFGVEANNTTVNLAAGTPIHWSGSIYNGMVTVSVDLSIVR